MAERAFDVVAFDGDDTLWHNERSYRTARRRVRELLAAAGVAISEEELDVHVNRTELGNLEYYGYGVSSFVLSLIETSIDLTGGRIRGGELRGLIDLAKHMLTEEIELFSGARDAVQRLASTYPLMLITMGDLLHQRSKLDRSGLQDHFQFVEVVSRKTPHTYRSILSRHRIDPNRFLMVGNSLRSDVGPVVEVGGWAVHVPAALSWSYEHADPPDQGQHRYFELASLDHLAGLVETLERTAKPVVRT